MKLYSVRKLEESLQGGIVYEGAFPTMYEQKEWDLFDEKQGILRAAKLTVRSNAALISRAFHKK